MSLFPPELLQQMETLLRSIAARNLTLTTAESCTGGLIAGLITEIPGSSAVFTHGYITYADAAKTAMLSVPASLLKTHGAVSEPIARAMAEGALKAAHASLSIAVTGIAGPGGGSTNKPVGLVHLASARTGHATLHYSQIFSGDRAQVRLSAVQAALDVLQRQLNA